MARKDDVFKVALSGKRIPVLTLDSKWHQLFTQAKPDRRIRRLEEKLNDLLKRQGKANTEVKEIRKLKKRLMQEIVENAQEASVENDGKAQKKAEDNKRLIGDCMNQGLYSYMHDIFGADVIDIFDMKYKKDNGKKD